MAQRPIRIFGDPVLKTISDPIRIGDERAAGLIADLLDTVKLPGSRRSRGTADRGQPARLQLQHRRRHRVHHQPRARGGIRRAGIGRRGVPVGARVLLRTAALSVRPGQRQRTWTGNPVELSGTGLMAQALQHETDHLDGKLFIEGLRRNASAKRCGKSASQTGSEAARIRAQCCSEVSLRRRRVRVHARDRRPRNRRGSRCA